MTPHARTELISVALGLTKPDLCMKDTRLIIIPEFRYNHERFL